MTTPAPHLPPHLSPHSRPTDGGSTANDPVPNPSRAQWLAPAALIVLSLIPVAAGAIRLGELTGGADITPGNARFFATPLPVVLHIVGASVYCLLGAFQFVPGFRRRRPGWHRAAGRVLVVSGLVAALSGLWMTLFYPLPDGDLLTFFRLAFGSAWVLSIVLAFVAIRRREIDRHRAWMIRGYAIGQSAGTQSLTILLWILIVGMPGEFTEAMLMAAGWVINLAVAEWIIRRRPTGRRGWQRLGHGGAAPRVGVDPLASRLV